MFEVLRNVITFNKQYITAHTCKNTIWAAPILCIHVLCLQGCILVNGSTEYAHEANAPDLGYLPIGIPFLLGGHGTSVPITKKLSLTAKHVAKLDYSTVVAYHPDCDIALIEEDNSNKRLSPLGKIYANEQVRTFGIGFSGKVIVGKGKYYLDVHFVDSDMFANCLASITDAPVQSGMSGGGAFNDNDELVGIISGMSGSGFKLLDGRELDNERTSVFVSTLHIKKWLINSVETYYNDPNDVMATNVPILSTPFFIESTGTD